MLSFLLISACLLPEPPHIDFIWLSRNKEEIRLELSEQPGAVQSDIEHEWMESLLFEVPGEPDIKGSAEGSYAIANSKKPSDIAGAQIELGFQYDPRSKMEKLSYVYSYAKSLRETSVLTKKLSQDCEIILRKPASEWVAQVRFRGKIQDKFRLYQFVTDPEKATMFEPESGENSYPLGKELPQPLWLAAIVFEEKLGTKYGEPFDNVQHVATLNWQK